MLDRSPRLAPLAFALPCPAPSRTMIPVFDAHCDALQLALDLTHDLGTDTRGHFDFVKAAQGGVRAVSLTAWVDGPYAADPGASKRRANALLDAADDLFTAHPDKVRKVLDGSEITDLPEGVIGCVLAIEGGHAIEDDLAQIEHYANRGVRVMTLTWNNHLSWARSCRDGAAAGVPDGLSSFGREVVARMGDCGMLVDLSHAGVRTFYDALECAAAPPIVSHSGCRALSDHPRNIDDDQLCALAECGGVIGVPFATAFLDEDERAAERRYRATAEYKALEFDGATEALLVQGHAIQRALPPFPIEHVVRHVMHALEIAGPAHVAIGSDFDGIDRRPADLADASTYQSLLEALRDVGVTDETIRAVAFDNAARAMSATQPA